MTAAKQSAASLSALYADSIESTIRRAGQFQPVEQIVRLRVAQGQDRGRLFDAVDLLLRSNRVQGKLIGGVPSIGPLFDTSGGGR